MLETHHGPKKKKHMVASDETKCQGCRQPRHRVIETDRKRGEAVLLGQDSFPDVSTFRILAVALEICLLPGKPIGLLITLERIGPAQHGGCLQEGGGGQWLQDLLPLLTFLTCPQIFLHLSHSPASQSVKL